ncbi:hypothetical protein L914_17797 [Phytophthora nicotianae]|uniref:Uncharacterized protein n=2 Tax=Phytophthora nicotianae TaxID=4792 RepID=V9DVV7_PHYNI|nr:hypothetical protein F443_22725 [Phytophthora nicotianae P1569]ETM35264.1 hypothetical protein L914_17797 [Phytophthora nicotianae]
MGMKVADIGVRITNYFVDFDRIVDEHELNNWVGRGGRQLMKTRCKLLVKNLFLFVLRVDFERLVAVTHQQAKHNGVALYALVVTRAKSQQHYHTMQYELKSGNALTTKPAVQNK